MIRKDIQKAKAIELRKNGHTYNEILSVVPVAKSTLSLWLRSVSLSNKQHQRITEKKLASAQRGADARKHIREVQTSEFHTKASGEIGRISKRELFLIGTALYWAEGSKQKAHNVSQPVVFMNSDPVMIRLILGWFYAIGVAKEKIVLSVYIHDNQKHRIAEVVSFWSRTTGFPRTDCSTVYYKRHIPKPNRHVPETYNGSLRVAIRQSTDLSRIIGGWIQGIAKRGV